jgi:hypothetical protein
MDLRESNIYQVQFPQMKIVLSAILILSVIKSFAKLIIDKLHQHQKSTLHKLLKSYEQP